MNRKIKDILLASIPLLSILIIWYISYYFNLYPKWLLPSPSETASTFWKLAADGTLANLISISITNAVPAFIFALCCAVILGTLIGINTTIKISAPESDAVNGGSVISKGFLAVRNTIEARLDRKENVLRDEVHRILFIS